MQQLLDFLPINYGIRDLDAFREEVIPQVTSLVRSDFTGYREMDSVQAITRGRFWPPDRYDAERMAPLVARHANEHPLLTYHLTTRNGRALRLSDLLTQRQFHRLGLYHEVYGPMGIEDVLAMVLPVPAPGGIGVSFHRDKTRFSERDRLIADLLRAHLTQAYLNAKAVAELRGSGQAIDRFLTDPVRGLMVLSPRFRITSATPHAREWVRTYFERPSRSDVLPENLHRWLVAECAGLSACDDVPAPRVPLLRQRGPRQLTVRLLFDAHRPVLLLEEHRPAIGSLMDLGLTSREAQVLTWIAEGKTNADIGTILGVRPRTVAKHLEHIYEKLGVETRTAAARMALTRSRTHE